MDTHGHGHKVIYLNTNYRKTPPFPGPFVSEADFGISSIIRDRDRDRDRECHLVLRLFWMIQVTVTVTGKKC